MTNTLNADQGTEPVANALRQAADRLETINQRNQALKARCENEQWTGLDQINIAGDSIDQTREELVKLAEDIGVGGQIVRDARQRNQMAGSYESIAGTT